MGILRRVEGILSRLFVCMDWSIGQKRKARQRMLSDLSSGQLVAWNDMLIVMVTGLFANLRRWRIHWIQIMNDRNLFTTKRY